MKLGRLRRSVLTYQSDRKRRYSLMAVDPTQYLTIQGVNAIGGALGGTDPTGGAPTFTGQTWTFDGNGRLQVPAGLYYIQLKITLSFPLTGDGGPTVDILAYASDGDGGERATVGTHGIVNGEVTPTTNLVAYVDQGLMFYGFPGGYQIDVVQIAPLA